LIFSFQKVAEFAILTRLMPWAVYLIAYDKDDQQAKHAEQEEHPRRQHGGITSQ
jgi:hypothetical protein